MDSSMAYMAGASAERNTQEGIRARERSQHEAQLRRLREEYDDRYRALVQTHNELVADYNKLLGTSAQQREELQEVNKKLHQSRVAFEATQCAGRLRRREALDLQASGFSALFDSIEKASDVQLDAAWRQQAVAQVSAAYPLIFESSAWVMFHRRLCDELAKQPIEAGAQRPVERIQQSIAKGDAIAEPIYREFKSKMQS